MHLLVFAYCAECAITLVLVPVMCYKYTYLCVNTSWLWGDMQRSHKDDHLFLPPRSDLQPRDIHFAEGGYTGLNQKGRPEALGQEIRLGLVM